MERMAVRQGRRQDLAGADEARAANRGVVMGWGMGVGVGGEQVEESWRERPRGQACRMIFL